MKEEALKLADELDDCAKYGECDWVYPKIPADMIRKLVEQLDCAEDFIKQYQLFAELEKLNDKRETKESN